MSLSLPKIVAFPAPSEPRARNRRAAQPPRKPAKPPYDRNAQLPKLVGLWPHELEDCTVAGTERVIALLQKALRSERQRGLGGHWTYDINRHAALVEALREERARLAIQQRLPVRFLGGTAAQKPAAGGRKAPERVSPAERREMRTCLGLPLRTNTQAEPN